MTMPKTLAALPRSQYATLLDDVLGKLLDSDLVWVAAFAKAALSALEASARVAALRSGWVDFHLTACRTLGRGIAHRAAAAAGRIVGLRQGPMTKSLLDSRGAAVRSWGKAWNMEAMAATTVGWGRSDGDNGTSIFHDCCFSVVRQFRGA
jgi:hypothetical protein